MHDHGLESAPAGAVRSGLRASAASIGWTLCASAATLVFGLASRSVVLVAFGAVGLCDAAGSAALVVHFRHALRHEAISDHHERVAHRVVLAGLVIVGTATAAASVLRLAAGGRTHEPAAGIAVSAVSIAVLAALAWWKRRIAFRIPSQALLADSWLSLAGSLTATAAVLGTALNAVYGWWWIDPAAAITIALGALAVAVTSKP